MNIAELQIQAYNKRDLEIFLDFYSEDFKAYMLESGQKITDGREQLAQIMTDSFGKFKDARSKVLESVVQGDLIVQKEENHGHIPGKVVTSLTIYEVKDDKIRIMWFGGRTVE